MRKIGLLLGLFLFGQISQGSLNITPRIPIASTVAKTTTYTILAADQSVGFDSSGGIFTATLPLSAAAANYPKHLFKTTSDFNAVTIAASGSDTIVFNGSSVQTSVTLNTLDEEYELIPDGGTKYYVSLHKTATPTVAYTPPGGTYQGFGTPTSVSFYWARQNDCIYITGNLTTATTAGTEIRVGLPSGLTSADSTKIATLGYAGSGAGGSNLAGHWTALMEQSKTYFTVGISAGTQPGYSKAVGNVAFNSTTAYAFFARIPISGWYP